MFDIRPTKLAGCFELTSVVRRDARGFFVKTFHRTFFEQNGLASDFKEHYYSSSNAATLRGMHFQRPPHDHEKLVCCLSGEVLDVVVDLRVGSPTYGQADRIVLSQERGNLLYIPCGLAHGFYTLSAPAIMLYTVTTEYQPTHDAGIHWRSVPVEWPNHDPIVSERDAGFPMLEDFQSPFVYSDP